MTISGRASGTRHNRTERLSEQFKNEKFRKSFFARQLKIFLAAQIRALRGDRTQVQFGVLIGKPQSVVARLERESYGKVNLQTLIDIATQLDIALIVRFVSFPTFLNWTNDYSTSALAPDSYAKADTQASSPEFVSALQGEELSSNSMMHDLSPLVNAPLCQSGADIREQFPESFNQHMPVPTFDSVSCA
jgi:hypothetical protein